MEAQSSKFGNAWAEIPGHDVPDDQTQGSCAVFTQYEEQARITCIILREMPFKEGHEFVDPERFIHMCKHDVCSCGEGRQGCEEKAFKAYSYATALQGKILNWRRPAFFREY